MLFGANMAIFQRSLYWLSCVLQRRISAAAASGSS
jgi:hypothetical protein